LTACFFSGPGARRIFAKKVAEAAVNQIQIASRLNFSLKKKRVWKGALFPSLFLLGLKPIRPQLQAFSNHY
jgi:hypothetical protein